MVAVEETLEGCTKGKASRAYNGGIKAEDGNIIWWNIHDNHDGELVKMMTLLFKRARR